MNINISPDSAMSKEQNVSWNDQSAGYNYTVDSMIDETRHVADTDDVELSDFFARPVKLASYEWSTSVQFYEEFNPWNIFCSDPKVVNRMTNYNLLKARMCVKFMINGNGFYYGRLLANYKPLPGSDTFLRDRGPIAADNVEASQRPHIYIDPTTNQGGTMCLPFFWEEDTLSVVRADWSDIGTISLRELNELRHANGATDPITITVLGWLENVTLAVPTSNESSSLVPQSGMEKKKTKKKKGGVKKVSGSPTQKQDEYGPISGPSSTVAKIAGMLTNAPVIGPYMKATQIAASGMSNIASMFGYSRPQTNEPIHQYVPRPVGDLALCNVNDTSHKLAIDSKQELTVDPRVTGLGPADELDIRSIACRESFLDSTTWLATDSVDQVLASLRVTPAIFHSRAVARDTTEYHAPACAFASLPFKYWRGSMKYRFQVVSSAYHKGRLKIQYDPHSYANQDMNTQFTQIVDISSEKDFTFEVGWGHERAWLGTTADISDPRYTLRFAAGGASSGDQINGVITLSVLNTLTSPSLSAGDTVGINVFVSAGDDIEFAVPWDENLSQISYFPTTAELETALEPQSGMESPAIQTDIDTTEEPSRPMQDTTYQVASSLDDADPSITVYMGEAITSFRTLLKRYNFVGLVPNTNSPESSNLTEYTVKAFPPVPGITSTAWWGDDTHNYTTNNIISYLYPAFTGMRGAIRWKGIYMPQRSTPTNGSVYIRRNNAFGFPGAPSNVPRAESVLFNIPDEVGGSFMPSMLDGATLSHVNVNPVVEAEIPYQTAARFMRARRASNAVQDSEMAVTFGYLGDNRDDACFAAFAAVGEDFNLHFFVGSPIIYKK